MILTPLERQKRNEMIEALEERIEKTLEQYAIDGVPLSYGIELDKDGVDEYWYIRWDYQIMFVLKKEDELEDETAVRFALDQVRDKIRFKTYCDVEDAMEELEKNPEPTSENIQKIVQAVMALNAEIMSL